MTTPSFLKQLTIPRVLKGQSGNYWQLAANEAKTREFFVRLKFEGVPYANADGKVALVEGLQVNLVYLGDQFELLSPFGPLQARPYVDGDKTVQGILLAKLWVPMGEFHKNTLELYKYAKDVVAPAVEARFTDLFEAAEVKPTIKLADIFAFLIDDLQAPESLTIKPEVFINQEWLVHVAKIQKQNSEAMKAMEATAAEQSVFQKWEQTFTELNQPKPPFPTGPQTGTPTPEADGEGPES
jgi:hypothetical protein